MSIAHNSRVIHFLESTFSLAVTIVHFLYHLNALATNMSITSNSQIDGDFSVL